LWGRENAGRISSTWFRLKSLSYSKEPALAVDEGKEIELVVIVIVNECNVVTVREVMASSYPKITMCFV
jgi:hypothetical protein